MEVQGTVIQILEPVTGTSSSGPWVKQEFILQTIENYPKKICISVWGEKVETFLKDVQIGVTEARVQVSLESRENGARWYTEIKAWKLQTL